jgi:hypothetical protein
MDVANVRRGGGSKCSKFTRRSIVLVVILLGLETFVMQLFHAPDYGLSASDHSPGHLVPSVAMAGTHRAWPQGLDASQASTGVRNNSAWAWPNYTTTDGGQSSGFYGLIVRGFSGHQNGVLDYRNYGGTNTPPASVVSNEGTGPIEGLTADAHVKLLQERKETIERDEYSSAELAPPPLLQPMPQLSPMSSLPLPSPLPPQQPRDSEGSEPGDFQVLAKFLAKPEATQEHTATLIAPTPEVMPPSIDGVFRPGIKLPNFTERVRPKEFLLEPTTFSSLSSFADVEVPLGDSSFPLPPPAVPYLAERYRGMFRCDVQTGCPTYAASFLTSKRQLLTRFVNGSKLTDPETNMESASYWTFGIKGVSAVWTSVDALDFSVEHISMYERVLKSTSMTPSPLRNAILAQYDMRLQVLERDHRLSCSEGPRARAWRRSRTSGERSLAERTVAVMPFYAVGAGSGHSIRTTKLRYLNITVHSIRCHFASVVIAVSHKLDRKYVLEESGLPIYDVIFHTDLPKPSSTGIYTIRRIQDRLLADPRWAKFKYIFYTEADQILHLRASPELVFLPLMEAAVNDRANLRDFKVSASPGKSRRNNKVVPAVVVPHRFHSVPMSDDFRKVDAKHNRTDVFEVLSTSQRPLIRIEQMAKQKGGEEIDTNAYEWYFPDIKKPTIRRELELYQTRPRTTFDTKRPDDTCCFLRDTDDLTPVYSKQFNKRKLVYDPTTELFRVGNGFGMVAGDCCFICIWKNRYCHNTCTPRRAGLGQPGCSDNGFFKSAGAQSHRSVSAQPSALTLSQQTQVSKPSKVAPAAGHVSNTAGAGHSSDTSARVPLLTITASGSSEDITSAPEWLQREKAVNTRGY